MEILTFVLDNATIASTHTAAIIVSGSNAIEIQLEANTTNTISDGGNDDTYDAAIYSESPLTFSGSGDLVVNGNNQEGISTQSTDLTFNGSGTYTVTSEDDGIGAGDDGGTITFNNGTYYIDANGDGIDSNQNLIINGGTIYVTGSSAGGDAGIDTDGGYVINGGSVFALGSDMIETPESSSEQYTLAFTLDTSYQEGSTIELVDSNGTVVATYENTPQGFQTIIISNADLDPNETYTLVIDGSEVSVNGTSSFTLDATVTLYGNSQGQPQF